MHVESSESGNGEFDSGKLSTQCQSSTLSSEVCRMALPSEVHMYSIYSLAFWSARTCLSHQVWDRQSCAHQSAQSRTNSLLEELKS